MKSILINAYACSPNMGSEPGMAWNWCVNLAKYCNLYIITEGEFQNNIEESLPKLPQGRNMHFYYNPVSPDVRKMCWNQGDWRFYKHYKEWQYRTYEIAKDICNKTHIDILHQLNMIGFREPGYLWMIKDIPFVWGPIGGLKQFPEAYLKGSGIKMTLFNKLKNRINVYQIKHDKRVDKALNRASLLISSIPDSYRAIKKYKGLESVIIPETGCFNNLTLSSNYNRFKDNELNLIWVGKFDFRKQLEIALRAIAKLKHLNNIKLAICGTGSDSQIEYYHHLVEALGIQDNINWLGNRANNEILRLMCDSDLFFFTSISEDTSTVVLESISCHLPVLCHDACGFGFVINENVGKKIPLSNPMQSINDFAKQIEYLYYHKEELKKMSDNCKERQQELSWDNKAKQVLDLYKKILS